MWGRVGLGCRGEGFAQADVEVHRPGLAADGAGRGGNRPADGAAPERPEAGARDGRRHVRGIAGARPEDAGLHGRLVGTRSAQLVGPVGADDDQRGAGVVGLHHRGVQVGDRRARRGHHGHGRSRAASEPEGEEAGAALVDPHVQPQPPGPLGGEHGIRQRRRPRPRAEHDLADPVPDQLVDEHGRQCLGRVHGRKSATAGSSYEPRQARHSPVISASHAAGAPSCASCQGLVTLRTGCSFRGRTRSMTSSDTERTGRPSTPPADACQASRPSIVPRGAPSATRRVST